MNPALALDSASFAHDLHTLLRDIDPARWQAEFEAAFRSRLASLEGSAAELRARADGTAPELAQRLAETQRVLTTCVPTTDLPRPDARAAWKELRAELARAYTDLSHSLEAWDIHVPKLRPTNYARNVLHVVTAGIAISMLLLLQGTPWLLPTALFFAGAGWSLEATRRIWPGWNQKIMSLWGPVAHPHEHHRVNSATWYCTALVILAALDAPAASLLGLVALGVGDPAAAVIGRRWGRTRLANGRSLEGFAAFMVASLIAGFALLSLVRPELSFTTRAAACAAASLVGAIVELMSRRVDDNLSIPLSAAVIATLVVGNA